MTVALYLATEQRSGSCTDDCARSPIAVAVDFAPEQRSDGAAQNESDRSAAPATIAWPIIPIIAPFGVPIIIMATTMVAPTPVVVVIVAIVVAMLAVTVMGICSGRQPH